MATNPPGVAIFDKDQKIQEITRRYQYRVPLLSVSVAFYTDRPAQSLDAPSR
jgi:hypothetical protein